MAVRTPSKRAAARAAAAEKKAAAEKSTPAPVDTSPTKDSGDDTAPVLAGPAPDTEKDLEAESGDELTFERFPKSRLGNTGASILQLSLHALGYGSLPDGNVGPETIRQIRSFQRDHDLEETGVATAALWDSVAGEVRKLITS